MAGILHDVVDDTCESLRSIEEAFGDDVATMVAGVSRLSFINQVRTCVVVNFMSGGLFLKAIDGFGCLHSLFWKHETEYSDSSQV